MSHSMDTRGKGKGEPDLASKEAEIQILDQKMRDKEARLRSQERQLQQQLTDFEAARKKLEGERDDLNARHNELTERERELKAWSDRSELIEIQPAFPPQHNEHYTYPAQTGACTTTQYSDPGSRISLPKVTFREATESVPNFDGYNIPLQQFTRACRRARELVPPAAEKDLTRFLINKLRNRAYYAVEDEPCDTVTQLVDLLTGAFGSPKTIDQYRGELSMIYMKQNEHIIDYISRVKDLRTSIMDADRRTRGHLDPRFVTEIDALTARSFCDNLPLEYRLQLKPEAYHSYTEAFAAAKIIAKRQELDRQRYDPRNRENRDHGRDHYRINPIGNPVAHSTPRRYDQPPHPRDNPPRFGSLNHNPPRFDPPHRYSTTRPDAHPRAFFPQSSGPRVNYPPRENIDRPHGFYNHPTNPPERRGNPNNSPSNNKVCRYCKNPGHEIEECRKRQYNNARKNDSGNPNGTPGPSSAARADNARNTRPVNPINAETANEAASQP